MHTVALKAHFDGERIVLDEAFELPRNASLIVTLVTDAERERADWEALALSNLARAYGPDEPEYSVADIKRPL
jgi:hypothetical protein